MNSVPLAALRALQHPDGGFPSVVTSAHGHAPDLNGFTTAMVLRTLRHLPDSGAWRTIRTSALGWLVRCRSASVPGAYAFWPDAARPDWARALPADTDDTAVMLTELLRHHWIDRDAALSSVWRVIVPCRVAGGTADLLPPWIRPGSFHTWLAAPSPGARRLPPNLVDCCVNTNILALMAQLGARHLPGYAAALQTVLDGLAWAAAQPARLAALTPFYPAPRNLLDALEHAVDAGVEALRAPAQRLAALDPGLLDARTGLCQSAYGRTIWTAPAFELARAIAQAPPP